MAIDKVTLNVETDGDARASEIIADLRTVAETLYFPMKLVGFWDYQADMQLCPHEERGEACPHKLPKDDPRYVDYAVTMQRERRANIQISFPHAGVTIFLS